MSELLPLCFRDLLFMFTINTIFIKIKSENLNVIKNLNIFRYFSIANTFLSYSPWRINQTKIGKEWYVWYEYRKCTSTVPGACTLPF
jgi:hypothetical protein